MRGDCNSPKISNNFSKKERKDYIYINNMTINLAICHQIKEL